MAVTRPPASTMFSMLGLLSGWLPSAGRVKPRTAASRESAPRIDFDRIMAGVQQSPREVAPAAAPATAPIPRAPVDVPDDRFEATALDARRRRVRDRYIAARFPGVAKCGADLADEDKVIRTSRLMFEDARAADALELLELAVQEYPTRPAPWLAQLEILYLVRDAAGYTRTARAFSGRHASEDDTWKEICRMGQALAPGEPLFAGEVLARDHEHYGPWPHTPNWIRSSWDLTSEVAAADFRNSLRRAREAAARVAA